MNRAEMDRLIEAHLEAEKAGNPAGSVAMYTDDVEHDVVGNPSVSAGKAEVAEFYRRLLADLRLDDIRSVRRYHGEDFVVDESIVTATAIGSPFGIPGRGRTLRFRLLHVFEVDGGVITRENAWLDLASVLAQLSA